MKQEYADAVMGPKISGFMFSWFTIQPQVKESTPGWEVSLTEDKQV